MGANRKMSHASFGTVLNSPHGTKSAAPVELNETKRLQAENLTRLRKRLETILANRPDESVVPYLNLLKGDSIMASNRTRKPSVKTPNFLAVYIPAVADPDESKRKSNSEIAAILGMGEQAVSARASGLRAKFEKAGRALNYPRGNRGAGSTVDAALAQFGTMLAALEPVKAPETTDAVESEVKS
jgi:hypothetical protein